MPVVGKIISPRGYNVTLTAGEEKQVVASPFDSFMILDMTADGHVKVSIDDSPFRRMYIRTGWRRESGEDRPRKLVLRNDGSLSVTLELAVELGGRFIDQRVAIDATTELPVLPRLVLPSGASSDLAGLTSAAGTTTDLVAIGGNANGLRLACASLFADGTPGAYCALRAGASRYILMAGEGRQSVLPMPVDIEAGVALVLAYKGTIRYSATWSVL